MINKQSFRWLTASAFSLMLSLIYYIILEINYIPELYVTLVYLIYFIIPLSLTAFIWSGNIKYVVINKLSYYLATVGTVMILISPIFPETDIILSYIPILDNILFIGGFSLFITAVSLQSIVSLSSINIYSTSNIIFILALICFIISYFELQKIIELVEIDIKYYYEILFWSFAHILRYLYIQVVMIMWFGITKKLLNIPNKLNSLFCGLLLINLSLAIFAAFGHLFYDIVTPEFKSYYENYIPYIPLNIGL